MTAVNSIILLIAKVNPTDEELQQLDNFLSAVTDWMVVVERLVSCNMAPLFYVKLPSLSNRHLVTEEALYKLKIAYFHTLSRSLLMYQVLEKVVEVLSPYDIRAIALKGAALSDLLYGDVALRLFSDIDLLIKEEEAEKAFNLLVDNGFQTSADDKLLNFLRENIEHEHLPQLVYKGIPVEIHTRLHSGKSDFEFKPLEMWKNAQKTDVHDIETYIPDMVDMLIHVCIHLDKHYENGQIQLAGFSDIVNLLDMKRDELDWSEVIRRAMLYRCEKEVFKYIVLANKYYKAYIPNYIKFEYETLITEEDDDLFIKYLSGFHGEHFSVASVLKNLNNLKTKNDKLRYLFWMIFPTKKYMMRSYRIKNPRMVYFYYPYRYWLGVKGLFRVFKMNRKEKRELAVTNY